MIRIEIHGDSASDALAELKVIAAALTGTAVAAAIMPELTRSEPITLRGKTAEEVHNPEFVSADPTAATEFPDEGPTVESGSNELDAHGHPWSADLHASTRGQTKDGLWRMKVGVSRPDPMPGFPKDETPSSTSTASPASTDAAGATEPAGGTPTAADTSAAASQDDDDEFAAFRNAAAKVDAADAEAAANVPARVWTDADLGALCNQAAVKLGDPSPVKEIIASFMPEGTVAHSRNVPVDKRAEFAAAVEAKAGIGFDG